MEKRVLKLVPKRNHKRIVHIILFLFLILILGLGIWYARENYSIESIKVTGADTYTDAEVIHAVQMEDYVPNTLVMILFNRVFGQNYLPFVDRMTMTYDHPHELKIKVKEKLRAGVFEYMGKYVYFNEKGMAMESRNHLFDGIPVITGLEYDKLVLGEKIPVGGDYFSTIVMITKKIAAYELPVSEIHFDSEDEITLTCQDYSIYLGSRLNLEDKMARIPAVLKSLSKDHKKGTVDLSLYTDEKAIITYRQ